MTTMTQMIQARNSGAVTAPPTQTVSIINGTRKLWASLKPVLEAYRFDVVFVESTDQAYSHIKQVRPNFIILCIGIGDADGVQVLSMLKLDDETRKIPLLTYLGEYDGQGTNEAASDAFDADWILASTRPHWPMN